jgi:hypothetical protein
VDSIEVVESEAQPNGKGAAGSRGGSTATRREKPLNGEESWTWLRAEKMPVELGDGANRREVGKT